MSPEKKEIDYKTMVEITPKKDYLLNCPPHFSKQLVKGEKIKVPQFLLSSLKTEGVQ